MKKWILRASVLALAATACKKNNDPESALPPATQDGRNTGGCLVNGQPFVASRYGGDLLSTSPTGPLSGGFSVDSVFSLTLHRENNGVQESISLTFKGHRTGTYRFNGFASPPSHGYPNGILNQASFSARSGLVVDRYITDARHTGRATLTRADVQRGFSAGTFEFVAVNARDSTKTLTITSGRFDRAY